MSLNDELKKRIDDIIASDNVVLFMKGNRHFPQCGFSARVVQTLDGFVDSYTTINVLSDPGIRQGIKEYSNWPTIPQLYVKGEFIGGCDIVTELHATGELASTLGVELAPVEPPKVNITDAAAAAIRDALKDSDPGDVLHLQISARFEHALDIGPVVESSVKVEANGVTVCIDRISAARANGLRVDFVERDGGGFKIDNPNAPTQVKQLSPGQLKAMLDSGEVKEVFDVRTPAEREIASLDKSRLLDDEAMAYIGSLDPQTPLVFMCHHGGRSQSAAQHFCDKGFREVYNVAGGIDAWSAEVDSSVPRY